MKCLAPWSEDGKWYEAVIEEIHPEGKASVGFAAYAHGQVVELATLKPFSNKSSSYSSSSSKETPSTSGATKRSAPKETIAERYTFDTYYSYYVLYTLTLISKATTIDT